MSATLELARDLIRRASVTPQDGGCQALIGQRLEALGFTLEPLPFGEVSNLWARRGRDAPLLAFAGHTDVVPPGPAAAWTTPPFEPAVRGGWLYGRGAADMKGSLAAMVTACEAFLAAHPGHRGSLALLLTSDEEGPARDGTLRVVEHLQARGEHIDWCVVGEPSSRERLGDVVKNGRRGSLSARLLVHGVQGHVAYPEQTVNPVHGFAPVLAALARQRWDEGDEFFPPTTFQVSNLHAGTGADNVVPGELEVRFNFRYAAALGHRQLRERVEALLADHGLDYDIEWIHGGEPFLTRPGPLLEAVRGAVYDVEGLEPALSTAGGTSDGRFVAPTGAEVVELGPLNASIHQVDERVGVAALEALSEIYRRIMERLLAAA